jgi:hypothetical protein
VAVRAGYALPLRTRRRRVVVRFHVALSLSRCRVGKIGARIPVGV